MTTAPPDPPTLVPPALLSPRDAQIRQLAEDIVRERMMDELRRAGVALPPDFDDQVKERAKGAITLASYLHNLDATAVELRRRITDLEDRPITQPPSRLDRVLRWAPIAISTTALVAVIGVAGLTHHNMTFADASREKIAAATDRADSALNATLRIDKQLAEVGYWTADADDTLTWTPAEQVVTTAELAEFDKVMRADFTDLDEDGVFNSDDRCPGSTGVVNKLGCTPAQVIEACELSPTITPSTPATAATYVFEACPLQTRGEIITCEYMEGAYANCTSTGG